MPTSQLPEPLVVSIKEAMRLLDLGRTRINRALNDGDLRRIKCGKKTLIAYADLQNWLARMRDGTAASKGTEKREDKAPTESGGHHNGNIRRARGRARGTTQSRQITATP